MALEVGVVRVEYLQRPGEPVYSFLEDMVSHGNWTDLGGEQGSAFLEATRERMASRATGYAREHDLSSGETDTILAWVNALPWQNDTVMLHFSW